MEIILHKNQTETTSKLARAAVETTDHLIVLEKKTIDKDNKLKINYKLHPIM